MSRRSSRLRSRSVSCPTTRRLTWPSLWSLLGPLLEPLATAGLVVVLVMFMLIRREDMRDRLISLFGRGQLTLTTKALDDASQRIGRYLLMQFIINASFGLAVAIGLTVIGIDYALLWGFLAGTLRYIPYLGPWLAASLPLALAVLITRGWTTPLLVIGLFLVLELFSNLVMEPWLYGRNVGVSVTAALVSVAFWTWLWGPIGMVLAFPLTVCLAVLGKYVPFLKFFDIMLGDQPPLEPYAGFYQRLLAKDDDEASDVAEEFVKQTSLDQTYDALFVPALQMARRDLESDLIDEEEHGRMLTAMREIAEDLRARDRAIREAEGATIRAEQAAGQPVSSPVAVLLCPARDETDELSLQLLEHLLDPAKCKAVITGSSLLSTEVAALVEEQQIQAVCVGRAAAGRSFACAIPVHAAACAFSAGEDRGRAMGREVERRKEPRAASGGRRRLRGILARGGANASDERDSPRQRSGSNGGTRAVPIGTAQTDGLSFGATASAPVPLALLRLDSCLAFV